MTTRAITGLSTEIVLQIIDFIPPEHHLDFACSCKYITACSSGILQRHRRAYRKYRAASDLDPTTIPKLLKSALGLADPLLAWHVRSFEVWRDRTSWNEWKTYSFETPIDHNPESEINSDKFCDHELIDHLEKSGIPLHDEAHENAIAQVQLGYDGFLKMLLITSCPRIRNLKFITQMHDGGSCLGWLKIIISYYISSPSESFQKISWPSGLAALRDVAVGVPSETWMDDRSEEASTHALVSLLRLPNIKSVYYKDLCNGEAERDDTYKYANDLPPRSSSVEHLFLDNCDELPWNFKDALEQAPRSLLSACWRSGDHRFEDSDAFVSGFARYQGSSLESLMFYDYGRDPHGTIHGYRCTAYQPDEFDGCSGLKQLSISIQDVELCASGEQMHNKQEGENNDNVFIRFVAECFPESMECLVLWDETGSGHAGDSPGETKLIERAVVKMIEDGHYENLKAIFLEEIEHRNPQREPRTALCFQDAITAGRERGVDIYTLTNRDHLAHKINFPEAPDKYDLETGPYWGKRTEDSIFNPYIGRRVPQSCRKCGRCESCRAEYPEELWKSVRDV